MSTNEFEPYSWLFPPVYLGIIDSSERVHRNLSKLALNTLTEYDVKSLIHCGNTLNSLGPIASSELLYNFEIVDFSPYTDRTAHFLPNHLV